ncbi:MAG TPA: hypothetical protein VMT20_15090 [Terriglobia bacterium]|nr:hypothetical protein [Terriglobia bacterium]
MSEAIATDLTKAATAAVETAPTIEAGVASTEAAVASGNKLAAASAAAGALSATLTEVQSTGTIGNADAQHVGIAAAFANLLSEFLAALSKI